MPDDKEKGSEIDPLAVVVKTPGQIRVEKNYEVFREKIEPHIAAVRELCEANNLGCVTLIVLGTDDGGTKLNTGACFIGSPREVDHLKNTYEVAMGNIQVVRGGQIMTSPITPMVH